MSYRCLKCGKEFKAMNPLGRHLKRIHNSNIQEYYNEFYKKPNEGICETCGKPTKFENITLGYRHFCSLKCGAVSKKTIQQREDTNLKKYGVKFAMHRKDVVEKIKTTWKNKTPEELQAIKDKITMTNREKYGVDNVFLSQEIQDRIAQKNLEKYGVKNIFENHEYMVQKYQEKYGVDNPGQIDWVKEKIANTNLERYGNSYILSDPEIRNKANITKRNKTVNNIKSILIDNNINCEYVNNYNVIQNNGKPLLHLTLRCNSCNNEFDCKESQILYYKQYLCPFCNKHDNVKSKQELEVMDYIQSVISDDIKHSIRTLLDGKELDLYIPSKNIAFEYNGLYWHSEQYVNSNYHLWKTSECNKQNIRLIHIFEDDWIYKNEQVKSNILNSLGLSNIIYLNSYDIKEVDKTTVCEFIKENSLYTSDNSEFSYGIYNNNELLCVLLYNNQNITYSNKLYHEVNNGLNILFNHFIGNHKDILSINTCVDIAHDIPDKWLDLGFTLSSQEPPRLYYVLKDQRVKDYIENKNKIYDCGYMIYKWNRISR